MMKIKLLQWNTWIEESFENKLKLIKLVKADIICLQELNIQDGLNEFQEILSNTGYFGVLAVTETGHGGQGNAIISKYPIVKDSYHYINDPVKPIKHYTDEGRVYLQAKISVNGCSLVVGTVHMSYTDGFIETQQKQIESEKLFNLVSENSSKFILAGDFNSSEKSVYIQNLLKVFQNSGPDFDQKTWTTKPFSYNGFEEDKLNWRLDFVFNSNDIKPIDSKIVKTNYSDHLPIVVEFDITDVPM